MSFVKREYVDQQTVITAENMNAIQDELLRLGVSEGSLWNSVTSAGTKASNALDNEAAAYNYHLQYHVGDYCLYQQKLYRCTVETPAAGETWNSSHWTAVTVGDEMIETASELSELRNALYYSKSGSTTRYVEINESISTGDKLYVNVTEWTGTETEKGFYLLGYLLDDTPVSITTTFASHADMVFTAANNYKKFRVVSNASSQSSNVTLTVKYANLSNNQLNAEIANNKLSELYHDFPLNASGVRFEIKKENSMTFGDAIDIRNDFERGLITQAGVYEDTNQSVRSRMFYPMSGVSSLEFTMPTGYTMAVRFFGADMTTVVRAISGENSNNIMLGGNERYCKFVAKKSDSTAFSQYDASQLNISITLYGDIESKKQELHDTILRDFSLEDSYAVNGYLKLDGTVESNANHKTTDYIFVKAGDKFDYSLVASDRAFVVYNLLRVKVDAVGEGTINTVCEGTYTVANDGYIRFTNRYVSYTDGYVLFGKHVSGLVQNEINRLDTKISESQTGVIQEYFKDEMETTIESVLALQTEPCITFPVITDIHYRYPGTNPLSFDHSIENIRHFLNSVKCDFVLNLGDSSDGRTELVTQIEYSNYQSEKFASLRIPYYMVQGNHELNIYTSTTYDGSDKLTNEQIYTLYFNNTPLNVVYNPACYMDYYVDFPLGVRMVVLDFSNQNAYKIGNDTVSWFRDTALDSSKTILLTTHYSPIANHNSYPNVYTDANYAVMVSIIEAFINNGGTLVNIYGHSHSDFKFTSPWLQVALNNARPVQSDISESAYDYLREHSDIVSPAREYGTATEDCWTVCVLRPLSRKIDFIRFGAGSDRKGLTY